MIRKTIKQVKRFIKQAATFLGKALLLIVSIGGAAAFVWWIEKSTYNVVVKHTNSTTWGWVAAVVLLVMLFGMGMGHADTEADSDKEVTSM